MFLKYFSFLLISASFLGFSQELPPILKYSPATYGAGNQNWMISQDKQNFIYFANNEGLLQFNGSSWNLFKSPNETIIRSVKVIDNNIYTGSYMEFGFWTKKTNGQLKYTSLSAKIKSKILEDEQFWNIINYEQWVVFQSLNRIYIYDTKSHNFKIIAPKNTIIKSFQTNNSIYFQTNNEGLYEIESNKSKLISNDPAILKSRIINVFAITEGLLIQTQNNGIYKLSSGNLSKLTTTSSIDASSVYSAQMLSDGSFAIGTVSNGIFILDKDGKTKYHITQNQGLSNNTALSLFEDIDKNLWIGLDNGINCINLQSPVKSFSDDTGILGTVYASILHNGKLYIGTNQGLFYKNYASNNNFELITGTKGQVWSLFEKDGTLFCGHDSGTFIVDSTTARLLFSDSGTWKFENVPNQKNKILQGNYYGISILEKINNQWIYKNKVSGFEYSARFFEVTNTLEVYVSHEYKAIYRFQLDKNLLSAKKLFTYKNPSKGKNASLTTFNNSIFYAYKKGVFKLNKTSKEFEKNKLLSAVFEKDEYTSGKLIVDASNKIWMFSKNYIHYYSVSKLGNQLKQNAIPIPSSLTNSMLGFENITQIANSEYLIGTTDGYYTMNINDLSFKNYSVSISNISVSEQNGSIEYCAITNEGNFSHNQNNITFSYTVPEYNKYINAEYQYALVGFQDQWSDWNVKPTVNFKNLPAGNYVFKVKSKIANSTAENVAEYTFTISKPWYANNLMLFLYIISAFIIGRYIHKAYKSYYQRQEEKLIDENNMLLEIKELENEQELMKVRNEQLTQDVDTKSRELAVSTMSLIKKDELLALIKEDLKSSTDNGNSNIKSVISNITRSITTDNSWNVFKDAFDTADKDFLKKVKAAHPKLTPNDLRLCAYLRLNLSSKEIAPLINISVRSLEIKRYRLRKKMELSHENGLVDYILSI